MGSKLGTVKKVIYTLDKVNDDTVIKVYDRKGFICGGHWFNDCILNLKDKNVLGFVYNSETNVIKIETQPAYIYTKEA